MACVPSRAGFDTGRLFPVARGLPLSNHCEMKQMLARSSVWHRSYRGGLPVWNAMNMATQAAVLEEMEASEKNTMRWQRWQAHETMVLIAAKKQQALRSVESTDAAAIKLKKTRNKWKEIEAICREKGIERSAQQCQARWFRLISAFTQIRSWEDTRQPGQPSFWSLALDERKTMGFLPSLDRKTYDAMVELYNTKADAIEAASIKDEDEEEVVGHGSHKHLQLVHDGKQSDVYRTNTNCSSAQGSTLERESTTTGGFGNIESVHEAKRAELLEVGAKELEFTNKEHRGSTNIESVHEAKRTELLEVGLNELAFTHKEHGGSTNSGNLSIEDQSQQIITSIKAGQWECTIKEDFGGVECVHEVERTKVLEVADQEPESTIKDDRGSPVKLGNEGIEGQRQEITTSSKAGDFGPAGSTSVRDCTVKGDFWLVGSECDAKAAEVLNVAAKEWDFTAKDGKGSEMKSGNASIEDQRWEITTSTKAGNFQHAGSTSEQDSTIKVDFWSSESVHEAKRGESLEVAREELEFTVKHDKGSPIKPGTLSIEDQSQEITSTSNTGEFQHAGSTTEWESTIKGDFESVGSVHEGKRAEVLDVATKEPEVTVQDDRGGGRVKSGTGCVEDLRQEITISIKGGEFQQAGTTSKQESTIKGDFGSVESVRKAKIAEKESPMKSGAECIEDQSRETPSSSRTDDDVFLAIPVAISNVLRSAMQTVRKFFNL